MYALLTIVVLVYQVSGYELLRNIDYFGNDIFRVQEMTPLRCIDYCAAVPTCRLVTWFDNWCYLKNATSEPSDLSGSMTFVMYPEELDTNSVSSSGSMNDVQKNASDNSTQLLTPNPSNVSTNTDIEVPPTMPTVPVPTTYPDTTLLPETSITEETKQLEETKKPNNAFHYKCGISLVITVAIMMMA